MAMLTGGTTPALGRYDIVREIGRGGMAVVHLARQTDLDRDVALKELRLFHGSDPSAARRFLQESRVGAALTHPSVVTVYDYFENDGTPYIAMEYLERGSLRPHVGQMSVAENVGVLESVLAGLDHAARCDVVHRDIKPENLLVATDGRIKIADFGIAKASTRLQRSAFLTRAGAPVGTPWYMAPEQAKGEHIGPWTDLYSVGVLAWELFVGHVPFDDTGSAIAILLRHLYEEIPSAHTVDPSVDPAISGWIDRLLVKDPQNRARSASDAWDELEQVVTGLLGSCWRREARLRDHTSSPSVAAPLTPAPLTPAPFTDVGGPPARASSLLGQRPAAECERQQPAPDRPAVTQPDPPPFVGVRATSAAEDRPAPVRAAVAAAPVPVPVPDEAAGAWLSAPAACAAPPAHRPWPEPPDAPARWRTAAVGALAAVAAAVAGLLVGGLGDSGAPVAYAGAVVENSGLRLTVPAGWTRLDSSRRVPGLGLSEARLAGPGDSAQTGVQAGLAEYDAPSLLSRDTVAAVMGRVPAPVAVRLGGGVQAYRYERMRLWGYPGLVTIYAVPTTDRILTLACFAPARLVRSLDATCGTVAATLRPTVAKPVPVGPTTSYAGGISRALARLTAATAAPQVALDRASAAADQATAAGRLAGAHERAARALQEVAGRAVDGIASDRLITGVQATAEAYRRLASAARDGLQAEYDVARRTVRAMRTRLMRARQSLASAGYEVR